MKKQHKNKIMIIAVILLIIIAVTGIGGFAYYSSNLKAVSDVSEEIIFEVEEGESSDLVLQHLREENLIRNEMCTKLYMRIHGLTDIKFGIFTMDSSWDTATILENLNDATKARQDEVMITFREGLWAKDIAKLLEDNLGCDSEDLLALWNDETYIKSLMKTYPFLSGDILKGDTYVKLEGYLFPQTYVFKKDATLEEMTEIFLDYFQTIYEKYQKDIETNDLSIHEIITLASMVQYEASTPEDMKLVAGVFFNRLKKGMMLQSSVTVCYALYDNLSSAEDCEVNPDYDSLYNTYLYEGLPVGPILNPGEDAIDAVLHPTVSDYLYFVADIYGDGSVYYAKTYEEQLENQERFHLNK